MRGIAFIGGEGPSIVRRQNLVQGGDLIAAADSGLEAAEDAGIYPHWIIGDMDSLRDLSRLDKYPPERVIRYPPHKDYTDTELVLQLLWDQGCDEVWLVGGGGGRLDHLLAIHALFERERSPDRWITAREDIWRLREGEWVSETGIGLVGEGSPSRPLDWAKPGKLLGVSVFPLGTGPWDAESRGLHWPLAGLSWERGFFGLSNYAPDGHFGIHARRGRFLVISSVALAL